MEDMRNEAAREAAQKAKHEKAIEVAKRLLASEKMSYDEIAQMVELPVEEIKTLDTKKSA